MATNYTYSQTDGYTALLAGRYPPLSYIGELADVLNAATQYAIKADIYSDFPAETSTITIQDGTSGSTNGSFNTGFIITIPGDSGGFTPTADVIAWEGKNNTFRQYEGSVSLLHELSHVVIDSLGAGQYVYDNELKIAILADAVTRAKALGPLDPISFAVALKKILSIPPGPLESQEPYYSIYYNDTIQSISTPNQSSSYENIYNINREYTANSGLSDITNELYRTGYPLNGDWSTVWAGTGEDYDGHYKNLLYFDEPVVMLGNKNDNRIVTANGNDYIDGGHGSDNISGQGGDDTLIGGTGKDFISGGFYLNSSTFIDGNDTLYAGMKFSNGSVDDGERDTLMGGAGYDTYFSNSGDVIYDSDGSGEVNFNGLNLTGGTLKDGTNNVYIGNGGEYTLDTNNKLTFSKNGEILEIVSYHKEKNDLGITLVDNRKEIEIYVGDAIVTEGGDLEFTVGLNVSGLDADLTMDVEVFYSGNADSSDLTGLTTGKLTILKGQPAGTFTISTNDDNIPEDIENFSFVVTGVDINGYTGNDIGSYLIMNAGTGTITDNDGNGGENVTITISSSSAVEGNFNNNALIFTVSASRTLVDNESVTLDLSIQDITTNWSDYGFLSDDTITLNASNQSQTIALELFGDEEVENNEFLMINATVVNSTDVGNVQIISGTGTIIDDDADSNSQEGTDGDDILIGTDGDDVIDGGAGDDYIEGGAGDDILIGGSGNDVLWGGSGDDMLIGGTGNDVLFGDTGSDLLYGDEGNDYLYGGDDDDYLEGGDGSDYLDGGEGNDTLIGGAGADSMAGGNGNDTYIADSGDSISDSDGSGSVYLANEHLDGGVKETVQHIDIVTTNFTQTFIYCECETITQWTEVETNEWVEEEEFYLDKATGTKYILNGSTLSVISSSGSITINNFSDGDLGINLSEADTIDKKEITKEVFLEEDFCSPLVLDLNGNGNSSTRLNESSVYFDMDGDGFKERTAWVENGDGLLVLDKNSNGIIDNGSELFGNFTALADGNSADDGFSALLQHDENRDGKIDQNDAIYNQLNVWVDENQDGITDTGELKGLAEAGVASVNLSPYQSLMSYFDQNQDGVLNAEDDVFNYVLMRQDDNGGVTLFIPQVDNEKAKELFDNFKGTDIITTSNGDLLVNGISFANVANIATEGNDTFDGASSNDKIISLGGDDVLDGKAGQDIIEAGAGDDTLSGGTGNDLLRGGEGNDTYLFEKGHGIDTIEDVSGVDRIVFGDGIAHDGVMTVIDGNDLIIAVKDGNIGFNDLSDKVIFTNWFTQESRIETFEFNDDAILSASDIISSISLYEDTVIEGRVIAPDAASNVNSYVLVSDVVNGSLTFNADGTYSFDSANAFDSLAQNETAQVSFTYASLDANGNQSSIQEISLNVMGTDDLMVLAADAGLVDLSQTRNINAAQVVQGRIVDLGNNQKSVDHWVFDYAGGNLIIDVLSELSNNGSSYIDLDQNGVQQGIDAYIYLYKKTADGSWTYISSNDDSGSGRTDGTTHSYDSYLNLNLSAGEYMLSLGGYHLSDAEARADYQINNNYIGPYRITFNEELAFSAVPLNATDTGVSVDHFTFDVLANDTDVDSLSSQLEISNAVIVDALGVGVDGMGSVYIVSNELVYYPGTDFDTLVEGQSQEVNVVYTVTDSHGNSNKSVLTLQVIPSPLTHVDVVVNQGLVDIVNNEATTNNPIGSETIINQKITETDITVENIIGQNNSFQNLQEAGITELELNSAFVNDKENGNPVTYEGTYTDTDGVDHKVSDVWFDRDSQDTKYVFSGTISDDILLLPESSGSGRMKDLSMLMAEDATAVATLDSLLTNAKTSNWDTLNADVDALLAKWTQTEGISASQTRGIHSVLNHSYAAPSTVATYRVYAYAREVAILEAYTGASFAMNVNGEKTTDVVGSEMSEEMRKKYEHLHYDQLTKIIAQDLLGKDVYDIQADSLNMGAVLNGLTTILETSTDVAERTSAINLLSGLIYKDGLNPALVLGRDILEMPDVITQLAAADINFVLSDLGISGNVGRYEYGTSLDDVMDYGSGGINEKNTDHGKTIYAGEGNDSVVGTNSHDVIYGGAGDDILSGYAGDDLIFGGAGNDTLYAAGTNVATGAYGHSILEGGQGDDTLYGTGRQTTFVYRYGDGNDTIIDGGNVGSVPDVLEFRGIQSTDIKIVSQNGNDMLILIKDMVTGSFDIPSGSILIKNGFNFVEANNGSYSGSQAMEQFVFADGVLSYQELSERFAFGDNTYSFAKGDGLVTIEEVSGQDKLYFGNGITTSNIRVKVLENGDLVVGVDETGVAFENLADRLVLRNATSTASKIEEFIFQDGSVWNHVAMMALQSGTSEADFLDFSQSNSNLIVNALEGDDTVTTGNGSDLISGGLGNDTLQGGGGNDTYIYNALDGHDTIFDSSGIDTLKFAAGITSDMIEVIKDGTDLIVGLSEPGVAFELLSDTVRITDWYVKENRIESFLFEEDGSSLSISQIHNLVPNKEGVIIGTEGADTLIADPAYGAIVYAQGGDDDINGTDNSDLIYGEDGNDTLIGHGSDDLLYGGTGNDIYVYDLNDGIDTIIDTDGSDILQFGDAITAADLIARRDGDSIVIGVLEAGKTFAELSNKIIIEDWYKTANRIESIVFADASSLAAIDLVALMGSTQDDEIIGLDGDNTFEGLGGDDILRGKNFNDTYIIGFNEGNDTIIDSYGQDRLVFKADVLAPDVKVQWKQGTDDIAISITGSDDIITVQDWYENGRIETFEFNDGTVWTYTQIIDAMATQYDDVYLGVDADNAIYSLGGDDIISTFSGNDLIDGGEGHDVLESGSGDDTLIGSAGDDFMAGGIGNDTYVYNLNDGQDYITDLNGIDTLSFTDGITKEMLRFKLDEHSNNLLVAVAADATAEVDFDIHAQTILIEDWFSANHRIETISFANGESLDVDAFMQLVQTSGDDVAKALVEGSTLHTLEGNDTLLGNDGKDILNAGAGDDIIYAGKGDDILDAGTGLDFSNGQAGNDTYIFGRGYGKDSVQDHAQASYQTYGYITDPTTSQSYWGVKTAYRTVNGAEDTIEFTGDVVTSDIVVRVSGENLLVGLLEAGKSFEELSDVLEIINFSDANQKIENFRFSDGTVLSVNDMLGYIFTEGNDTVTFDGNAAHDVYTKAGNDIVNFGNGSDIVHGESGDDTLSASGGNDTLDGGLGNDILNGGTGNDSYIYTLGDGNDLITDTGGVDTLVLNGISLLKNIGFNFDGNDLILSMEDAAELRLANWLTLSNRIENIQTQAGETLDISSLLTPVVEDYLVNMSEDNLSTGLITASSGSAELSFEVVESASGSFVVDAMTGEWTYTPTANYFGASYAIVKVTNTYGNSALSRIDFAIEAVNDAPVTTETEAFILQDAREQSGQVEATDVDGDALSYSVTTAATNGTVAIDANGAWTYTVDGIYMGIDSAVITVDDGQGATATKTLTFDTRVTTPTLADVAANLLEDNNSNGTFSVVNPIGGVITYEVLTTTANGDFIVDADGNWNYDPSQDYNGSDSVLVKVTNEYGLSSTSTFSFDIEAVNDAPIVVTAEEAFTLTNIRDLDGKVEASDVDGDILSYSVATQALHGLVTVDDQGNWHYKAEGSFNGTDTTTILVDDNKGGTVTSTLNFTVEGYIYEGGDLVITDNGQDTLVMNTVDKNDLIFTRIGNNLNIAVQGQGTVSMTDYFITIASGVQKITTAQGDINLDKDVIKTASAGSFFLTGSANGTSDVNNLLLSTTAGSNLNGNNLDDVLFGGIKHDTLKGFGGNDTLFGGEDYDNLYGGTGSDTLYGDAGNDNLYGEDGNDALIGGLGNDKLYGALGNDFLWGDAGNDDIVAGEGDDFLSGGTGSDYLEGEGGNDTYFFEKGDQDSTINDHKSGGLFGMGTDDAGFDTVKFGEGVTIDDISFFMQYGDLHIQYGATDSITISDQDNADKKIERFVLADGSYLTNDDVDVLIQQLNAYASDNGIFSFDNTFIQASTDMMNIVCSSWNA